MRLRYYSDPSTGEPHIYNHDVEENEVEEMKRANFPEGWDEERVRRVLEHYEKQSDEEAVAEDEAAYESTTHTAMDIPVELVPEVRELLAKRRTG